MSSRYEKAFPGLRHVFIVAIHVSRSPVDTDDDITAAYEGDADGIILIRDYGTTATNDHVLYSYQSARKCYPGWWIGINLLGVSPTAALARMGHDTSGLWFDDAQLDENDPSSSIHLETVRTVSSLFGPNPPLLLPSVAFKYQTEVRDPAKVVRLAQSYADALVTSGDATGKAADLGKVRVMRTACEIPLGLASGVSAENVGSFMELGVDFFIVNTSISDPRSGRLDPAKVRALRAKIPRR